MFRGIAENVGTIAVTLVLIGIVAAVLVKLHKDRKQGKSSCGGSCGCCPMSGSCHKSP
ncbi:MAG: FeoB-associated Cys-rich membrane protein [Clostridiales bacterium]|nr:FeoB-associated Cys-rich membrane protein [Clostridiales bacterium]